MDFHVLSTTHSTDDDNDVHIGDHTHLFCFKLHILCGFIVSYFWNRWCM